MTTAAVRGRSGGSQWIPILGTFAAAAGVGMAVGMNPLLGLGATVVVGMVMLLVSTEWVTLAVVAVLYSNAAAIAHTIHGVPTYMSVAPLLLLIVPLLHLVIVQRQPVILVPALPWLLAFFLVQVVGTALAADPRDSFVTLTSFMAEGLVLYVALTNVVRTPTTLRRAMWVLLFTGALLGAISLHQSVTGNFEDNYLGFAQNSERKLQALELDPYGDHATPRLGGPVAGQNRYAQIMVMLVPLGIGAMRLSRRRGVRIAAVGSMLLIAVGATLTFSRGAAVGFLLLLMAMLGMRFIKMRHVLIMAVAITILLIAFPRYTERLASLGAAADLVLSEDGGDEADGAVRGRLSSTMGAVRVFLKHPILGVGPGMYDEYHRNEAVELGGRVEDSRQPHSLFPHIASENGVLGLIAFTGMIVVTLRQLAKARRGLRQARPDLADMMGAFTLSIYAYLATGLFLHLSYQHYFWMFMALAAAAGTMGVRAAEAVAAEEQTSQPRRALPVGRA